MGPASMIFFVALLGSLLGSLTSTRKEYFQVSALAHASVLGAAIACFMNRNMILGAMIVMPIRAFVIYRIESLEASLAIFGFSMGLAAYLLAVSGTVAEAWSILFGSLLVNDPIAIEVLKAFLVLFTIFFIASFDKLLYEAFDPETAYVYVPHLRVYVLLYYLSFALGTVILMRFLGAFLTIVVLSAPEVLFRGIRPRIIPLLYFALLSTIFYVSLYTPSPTGFSTFVLAVLVGLRSLKISS